MNSIPFNYGYCSIQFDSRHMPSANWESVDFRVDSESKIEYEEIALNKENVNYEIVKKIIGYRVNLDLILYGYYINNGINYGWQRIKNCQFRDNNIGDVETTPITGWKVPSSDGADAIIEYDATYSKCITLSDSGSSGYKYLYQNIYVQCAEKTYRLYFYVKGTGTYKAKIRIYAPNGSTSDTDITGSATGDWVSDNFEVTVPTTIGSGENIPYLIRVFLYCNSAGGSVSYAYPRLHEKVTGNQLDILEFLYYYRQCNTNDKLFYIYPYAGGENFWSAGYRNSVKFSVIPEKIEVLDIISRDKRLGQKIHLIAKSKNIITKDDFNYLTYRDIDTDNFYYEPYGDVYVPPSKSLQGLQDIFYVEKNT